MNTSIDWQDKYNRDVNGLNNEGDPIGGDPAGGYRADIANLTKQNNQLYTERAFAAIALARMALLAGFKAGVGKDDKEQNDDEWRVVLYVETPAGQVSWHIAPDDQTLLEGLPAYDGVWDGSFRSRDGSFAFWE